MAQNFIEGRRGQGFLLPPDVREWLAADHLAWFVIDAVGEMELWAFYAAYRADGHGRAAYEPSVMVALILYAFATRVRSSRAIERHCRQDALVDTRVERTDSTVRLVHVFEYGPRKARLLTE